MQAGSNDCPKGIKSLRLRRGYSLTEAATHIGITENELTNYEANPSELPIKVAVRLVGLYGTDFQYVCFQNCCNLR
ncbi:helix-turn-helix transcriptional regulator [Paenibacillus sp. LBL]|uniref:helix-turn-helix domain-containing protein n=1 Tax=Paenibacillus sp. LBL TaxID=2940563 RepID=UPI00247449B6|nr:helix-turn-helix transcriptional regulator [Paenibacillus sp. LBL]